MRSRRCSSASLRLLWPTGSRASTPSFRYPSSRAFPLCRVPPCPPHLLRPVARFLAQARQGCHAPRHFPPTPTWRPDPISGHLLSPLREVKVVVILWLLAGLPHVEGLVHDEQARYAPFESPAP